MRLLLAGLAAGAAGPVLARESLGIYAGWGAFRDAAVPRCYAIALAEPVPGARASGSPAYATISHWPRRGLRNQVHMRLSQPVPANGQVRLTVAGKGAGKAGPAGFDLIGRGRDVWAPDLATGAAIVVAMRSSERMRLSGRSPLGRRFSDTYLLKGAATAVDAAALACAGKPRR